MISHETMIRLYNNYNIGIPFTYDEFVEDSKRIVLVARLLDRWINNKQVSAHLLVNHVTIIKNVFSEIGLMALYEYISNFPELKSSALALFYFMGIIKTPAVYDTDFFTHLCEVYNG